ncbi:PUM-HD domain-containing protein [Aphelenchoides bicaudatus]|nr:PUM-HD domain-containing protein [Aphelenchoides bicaudatus]
MSNDREKSYQIFEVDDDVNAVNTRNNPFNNNPVLPKLNSNPSSTPSRVVGSPGYSRFTTPSGRGISPAYGAFPPQKLGATPNRAIQPSPSLSRTRNIWSDKPAVKQPGSKIRSSQNTPISGVPKSNVLSNLFSPKSERTELDKPFPSCWAEETSDRISLSFNPMSLNLADGNKKRTPSRKNSQRSYLSDSSKKRQERDLVAEISDADMDPFEALNLLRGAKPKDASFFFKSKFGSKYLRDAMAEDEEIHRQVSVFIIRNALAFELSMNAWGNFIVQNVPGRFSMIDEVLCDVLVKNIIALAQDKYGCRVVQAAILRMTSDLVRKIVAAIKGFELQVCLNVHGTHIIQCLVNHQQYEIFEDLFRSLTDEAKLNMIMEDKFGCRIIPKFLDVMVEEITSDFVPEILDDMVAAILRDAHRYTENEYANYVIQKFIADPGFERQRDYIIDNVLLGNLLRLSQGKSSSHVIEIALSSACDERFSRMCNEIFYDHKLAANSRSPIEVMMFNQYGNYVVQKLLTIATGIYRRCGDSTLIDALNRTVMRNHSRLQRYSSGKKIIDTLDDFNKEVSARRNQPMYYQY